MPDAALRDRQVEPLKEDQSIEVRRQRRHHRLKCKVAFTADRSPLVEQRPAGMIEDDETKRSRFVGVATAGRSMADRNGSPTASPPAPRSIVRRVRRFFDVIMRAPNFRGRRRADTRRRRFESAASRAFTLPLDCSNASSSEVRVQSSPSSSFRPYA